MLASKFSSVYQIVSYVLQIYSQFKVPLESYVFTHCFLPLHEFVTFTNNSYVHKGFLYFIYYKVIYCVCDGWV